MLSDGNTGKNHSVCTNPSTFLNPNRFASQHHTVIRVVIVGEQGHVSSNLDIIFNCDSTSCHSKKIAIDKDMIADFHLVDGCTAQRRSNMRTCSNLFPENFLENSCIFRAHWHGMVQLKQLFCKPFSIFVFFCGSVPHIIPHFVAFHDVSLPILIL